MGAPQARSRVTLAQLLDEIVRERAIELGEPVGIVLQQEVLRVERGLEIVVAGMLALGQKRRDLGRFPSRAALSGRQIVLDDSERPTDLLSRVVEVRGQADRALPK